MVYYIKKIAGMVPHDCLFGVTMRNPELHWDHRSRMRRRFAESGLDAFDEHEALEMLLYAPIPRRDTNEISHELLSACGGSIADVLAAEHDELCSVHGVGENTASYIRLLGDAFCRVTAELLGKMCFRSEETVGAYATALLGCAPGGSADVLYTDGDGYRIAGDTLYRGETHRTGGLAEKLLTRAESLGASAIILMHNHRHEPLSASDEDKAITESLRSAAVRHGIEVFHVIVSDDGYIFI